MNGDNYDALKSAVLGATQQGAPTSPLGSFPELAKLYGSSFQLPLSSGATKAQAGQTDITVGNQQAAQQAQQQMAAQQLKNLQDPSKYQQIKAQDGGFKFYDPTGKEISAYDYANVTGKNPSDLLKNSENTIDKSYLQDYKNLQDYINAKIASKNDPTAADKAAAIEGQVKSQYGIDLGRMQIQDVIGSFKQAYPTVYGSTNTGVPAGQTLIPSASAVGA